MNDASKVRILARMFRYTIIFTIVKNNWVWSLDVGKQPIIGGTGKTYRIIRLVLYTCILLR
jgi:hypothetical protein